ncbi:MAG: hypothetical protein CENE_01064 [Candidatus Celerinatantimonas neptuna]|nr:MAG: hypothetical protein CENE_01064 [Candidatus Celerinatantimonas neptuna]
MNAMKDNYRRRRIDGEQTRDRILKSAGKLFAENGYNGTTSKAICEASGVNLAAVNYHFGSREGLYKTILSQVHESLMKIDHLDNILDSNLSAEQKLEQFIDELVVAILDAESWNLRVWAREIAAPSECLPQLMDSQIFPKFDRLCKMISQVTGFDEGETKLLPAVFSIMAPCLLLLISHREAHMPFDDIFTYPPEELSRYLCQFLLAGLKALAKD